MAKPLVYIDGSAGSTGFAIWQLLRDDSNIELLSLPAKQRKDQRAKEKIFAQADIVILCLPDAAASKALKLVSNSTLKVIDASSAHRTAKSWCYGLAEISLDQKKLIANSRFVSNPGCYPTGFILLIKPLIDLGILDSKQFISYQAISGYSGGGRKKVDFYEKSLLPTQLPAYSARYYAITQNHKHLKEMQTYSGLSTPPHFLPTIANFKQGLLGHIPLTYRQLSKKLAASDLIQVYQEQYEQQKLIKVRPQFINDQPASVGSMVKSLDPSSLADTNKLEIFLAGNQQNFSLFARYDNLGKGAAGAALQNMNLMLKRFEYQLLL